MPATATSVTLAVPAGTVEGDLMVVALALSFFDGPAPDPAIAVVVPPDGWDVVLVDYPNGTLSWGDVVGDGNQEIRLGVYSRVASAAELASYTWDWSAGGTLTPWAAAIKTFTSVNGAVPSIHVAAPAIRTIAVGVANPITVESPSITTTQPGSILVTFFAARNGATGGTAFTVPAGQQDLTPAINLQTSGGGTLPLGLALFDETLPNAVTTGVRTSTCDVTVDPDNPFQGLGYALAIKGCGGTIPEPVPPPPQELAAVRFDGDTAGAWIDFGVGDAWITNLTIEMAVYFETNDIYYAAILENGVTANGRTIYIQDDNNVPYPMGLADSQTGTAGGTAPDWTLNPPPLNTWLYMTLRSPVLIGGDLIATWTPIEGAPGTTYTALRANGIDAAVIADRIALNGSGSNVHGFGLGLTARFQYVRARTGVLSDVDTEADRQSTDVTGWDFWWSFEDDGGGGVTCVDKTGNGRVATIVNGTLTTGPNIPVVP